MKAVLSVAALASAVAVGVVAARHLGSPEEPTRELVNDFRRLESEVSELRAQGRRRVGGATIGAGLRAPGSPESRVSVDAPTVDTAGVSPFAAPSSEPRKLDIESELEARRFQSQQASERVRTSLDAAFGREASDPEWGRKTMTGIRGVFASVAGSRLVESECRARLCRLVVQHDSQAERQAMPKAILGTPPFDQEVYYHYDPDTDPPRTAVFVARQGTSLSELMTAN